MPSVQKQCPVKAIEMEGGKPVWTEEKCTMCLGYLHRCPKNAISYDHKTENTVSTRIPISDSEGTAYTTIK